MAKTYIRTYKGKKIYKVNDHYEIEDCGKEFASIGECKRFISFMNEGY